jgi:hypothetical protein
MTIPFTTLIDKLVSHAKATGLFTDVIGYEPKAPVPTEPLYGAVIVTRIQPTTVFTSLNGTACMCSATLRLYRNMLTEPQADGEVKILSATEHMIGVYSGSFTLDGAVDFIDLLGANEHNTKLEATLGYGVLGQTMYRISDITVPLVLDDTWTQER